MNVKRLSAASLGHFSIDVLNSSVPMILTYLSGHFNLGVSQISFGAMLYTIFAAMTQPLFGALADRLRGRWLAAAGVLWTAIFFALSPLMPNYPAFLFCLTVGAFGSGAFHAAGMVNANAAGGTSKPTTAMSIFFLFGQVGLAVGPLTAGFYLVYMGLTGMVYAAIAVLPVVVVMFFWMRQPIIEEARPSKAVDSGASRRGAALIVVTLFMLLIALRATTWQSFVTLLPKYYDDQGISPAIYGQMLGVFTLSGALGTFFGGMLGDRFNRRMVIFLSTALCVPFNIGMLNSHGWLFVLTAGLAGLLLNIPHSIVLVMAQQLLPTRKGMVGGLVLGFMFASGAVGTWIASWFVDSYGLFAVLSVVAVLPLGAAFCALFLPSTRPVAPSLAEPEPAGAD